MPIPLRVNRVWFGVVDHSRIRAPRLSSVVARDEQQQLRQRSCGIHVFLLLPALVLFLLIR